ncbi:class I SAM-dependent methyltransferase [Aurantiacibacter suaedae]|uniref:class I SAM-dependent methyltransferase n=1 Tax=Aurantiacibacter suaedae TaxID=2545755 RepID=UPI0010F9EF8A|nr:class I SAM-dependent methyltransferase [Aurantiacibacter suaedae]
MADSDENWRIWGERDPYYAVLTDPRFRSDRIDENRHLFFESGRGFVNHWLAELERHFGALPRERALDFGCGVGRLTIPLSEQFGSVVGLDVSEAMLDEARRNSDGRQIDYLLSDDALSRVEGSFDFVNSCIVFQHIPVARGMVILSQLLDRIRVGGGCLIHFSTKRHHGWKRELVYKIRHSVPGGQTVLNLLDRKASDAPVMEMNEYSLDAVLGLFKTYGFTETLLRYENHGETDTVMILARRSSK